MAPLKPPPPAPPLPPPRLQTIFRIHSVQIGPTALSTPPVGTLQESTAVTRKMKTRNHVIYEVNQGACHLEEVHLATSTDSGKKFNLNCKIKSSRILAMP